MASASSKDYSTTSNYPRALSSILVSVGLLAVFITLASWVLLSQPIISVVRSYFYEVDQTSDLTSPVVWGNGSDSEVRDTDKSGEVGTQLTKSQGAGEAYQIWNVVDGQRSELDAAAGHNTMVQEQGSENTVPTKIKEPIDNGSNHASQEPKQSVTSGRGTVSEKQDKENPTQVKDEKSTDIESNDQMLSGSGTVSEKQDKENLAQKQNQGSTDGSNDTAPAASSEAKTHNNMDTMASVQSDCDLFHGEWFYDPAGPAYTNNTCPVITQMQNCQSNGRPDKEYESWRWKPSQCELPRFNGTKFLELMSGKTLAFVGDSVARNQMESLLCLLWQVEVPKNRGNRHMHRWYFKSKSVMIVRIWSSWLVHQTSDRFGYVPEGVAKLHLDIPDEIFMQYITSFDVVVLSSGHWFAKQSVYLLNNEIVGTQLWSPPKKQQMKINNVEAFGISVETSMAAIATHPNYTGLTILRSYSPDHYAGGAWNTGGSCTGKLKPILPGQLVENGFTNSMHEKQVTGFHRGVQKQTNRSKLKLMDITDVFSYRHDGHPGPYRSPDPNKITKRGPDGKPPPQDCLHWCMPGPVDTWNELVLEIIRREFEGDQSPFLLTDTGDVPVSR